MSLFDEKLIDYEGVTPGLEKLKKLADNRSNKTSDWNNKADYKFFPFPDTFFKKLKDDSPALKKNQPASRVLRGSWLLESQQTDESFIYCGDSLESVPMIIKLLPQLKWILFALVCVLAKCLLMCFRTCRAPSRGLRGSWLLESQQSEWDFYLLWCTVEEDLKIHKASRPSIAYPWAKERFANFPSLENFIKSSRSALFTPKDEGSPGICNYPPEFEQTSLGRSSDLENSSLITESKRLILDLFRVSPDDNKTSSSAEMDLVCFGLCLG
ncbi:hypothetical protein CEXT_211321 [Caerostris extrusa]|uniref:Uncharacterized protein n=1 Tax=Caerostris extrusa TaxID=172846 RepID=A0AAV4XBA6_CAEEX|nr:hypothetical protein CEXT_211321 [Caerostris extrusa]